MSILPFPWFIFDIEIQRGMWFLGVLIFLTFLFYWRQLEDFIWCWRNKCWLETLAIWRRKTLPFCIGSICLLTISKFEYNTAIRGCANKREMIYLILPNILQNIQPEFMWNILIKLTLIFLIKEASKKGKRSNIAI